MQKNIDMRLFAAALLLGALVCGCFDPFFPTTGIPNSAGVGRSTPAGTVQQLFTAYETRQINLFIDLFSPTKDFRFYVSPSFQADYARERAGATLETIDSMFSYVRRVKGISQMYYWTYDDEIEIHDNLFTQAMDISLNPLPQAIDTNAINYFSAPDGTLYAEVIVRGGEFQIRVSTGDQTVTDYFIDIGEQAFYLKKDPQNQSLWVIAKWFDLGILQ
jgi:hypothetical protein